jgi:two-component system, LytTR family, response regulator
MATPLRALIVDDEVLGRRRLRRLLGAHADVQVLAECTNGADALTLLRTHELDVVFLDVQMPGKTGFDVVRAAKEPKPIVVFVTAFTDFALDAFEVNASDYLLKPVSAERLAKTLERVRTMLAERTTAQSGRRLRSLMSRALKELEPARAEPPDQANRLRIRQGDRFVFLRVAEVDWFEADGNHIRAHIGKAVHAFRETVAGLEDSLDPKQFVRIHRSTIVNVDRIQEFEPWSAGDGVVVLTDGTRLRMSRTYGNTLRERLRVL